MRYKTLGHVVDLLKNYSLLDVNRSPDCFLSDTRYTGTDFQGGKITEGFAETVQDCQESCVDNQECRSVEERIGTSLL